MRNHLAVLLAAVGLFGLCFPLGVAVAVSVGGGGLFVGSVLLLIDFPDGNGGSA